MSNNIGFSVPVSMPKIQPILQIFKSNRSTYVSII